MAQERTVADRVPLGACDYFLLALDKMMSRAGQGHHLGQTILELEEVPAPERLRQSLEKLNAKHPLLTARIKRDFLTRVPYWVPVASDKRKLPFSVYSERGASGVEIPVDGILEDFHRFCEDRLNQPIGSEVGPSNFRVDLVLLKKGGAALVTTWSHLLLDGKGAELILSEWLRLAETDDLTNSEESPAIVPAQDNLTFWERFKSGRASAHRFGTLSRKFIRSLGGTRPIPAKARFRVVTLTPEETAKVKEQAIRLTGALFNMPFYLACSTRVHDTILRGRGVVCPSFIVSLPVQIRRKGVVGPIFQNHLSILFFHLTSEELATVESSTRAVQNDFMLMMRDRLDVSFLRVLSLMRRLPLSWYIAFAKSHFRGELASFFHSHTGPLSPDIRSFFGSKIRNAYHIPTVSTPPGSGIFMCERDGMLNVTFSWREGALSEAECDQMVTQLIQDMQGAGPSPEAESV